MHALFIFKLPKHPSSRWHDDDDDDDVKIGGRGCTLGHKNSCPAASFLDASYAAGFSSILLYFLAPNKRPSIKEEKGTEEVLTDDFKVAWAILAKVIRT